MEKAWLGEALSGRAKLYRKPRAGPNFLVQLIDYDYEFTVDSKRSPRRVREDDRAAVCCGKPALPTVLRNNRSTRESGLCLAYRAGEPPRTSIQDLRRSATRSIHAQSLAHLCPNGHRCGECAFRRHHVEAGVARSSRFRTPGGRVASGHAIT